MAASALAATVQVQHFASQNIDGCAAADSSIGPHGIAATEKVAHFSTQHGKLYVSVYIVIPAASKDVPAFKIVACHGTICGITHIGVKDDITTVNLPVAILVYVNNSFTGIRGAGR